MRAMLPWRTQTVSRTARSICLALVVWSGSGPVTPALASIGAVEARSAAPRLQVIIIANDEYVALPPLKFSAKDGNVLAKTFQDLQGTGRLLLSSMLVLENKTRDAVFQRLEAECGEWNALTHAV